MTLVAQQHIIIDATPSSNAPLILAGLSLALSVISILVSLRLASRSRRSTWYHKVAVDPLLEDVFTFFDQARVTLTESAILYGSQKDQTGRKTTHREITRNLAIVTDAMMKLYEQVAARVEVFQPAKAQSVRRLFENDQEVISVAVFDGAPEVQAALIRAKVALVEILRSSE